MQLGLSIYLPLVVGQTVRNLFPKACKKVFIDWNFNKLGSVCLLILLWSTYDQAFASHAFANVPTSNSVFIVFISIGLWIVYFGIAFLTSTIWLPREDVVAICYCVPAKGIVMGYPLSATIWSGLSLELESKILIPIVIYQGLQLAFGSILIHVFRRWVERQHDEMKDRQEGQRVSQNSNESQANEA